MEVHALLTSAVTGTFITLFRLWLAD